MPIPTATASAPANGAVPTKAAINNGHYQNSEYSGYRPRYSNRQRHTNSKISQPLSDEVATLSAPEVTALGDATPTPTTANNGGTVALPPKDDLLPVFEGDEDDGFDSDGLPVRHIEFPRSRDPIPIPGDLPETMAWIYAFVKRAGQLVVLDEKTKGQLRHDLAAEEDARRKADDEIQRLLVLVDRNKTVDQKIKELNDLLIEAIATSSQLREDNSMLETERDSWSEIARKLVKEKTALRATLYSLQNRCTTLKEVNADLVDGVNQRGAIIKRLRARITLATDALIHPGEDPDMHDVLLDEEGFEDMADEEDEPRAPTLDDPDKEPVLGKPQDAEL